MSQVAVDNCKPSPETTLIAGLATWTVESMSHKIKNVVIVGAGPVGLLGALELARLGISVQVIDFLEDIDPRPRAAGYGPSAVR